MAKRKAYKVIDHTTGMAVWRDCLTHEIITDFDSSKVDCCLAVAAMKCLRKREYSLFYDNGFTPGSSTNDGGKRPDFVHYNGAFTVLGWETGLGVVGAGYALGPFTGWTNQLQNWVAFGDATTPYANTDYNYNVLPAPTWRSWKVEGCDPDAKYGKWTIQRDDGCIYTLYPLGYTETYTDIERLDFFNCETNLPETRFFRWIESDGEKVREEIGCPDDIACYRSCDYKFDPVILDGAESGCTTKEYRACDKANDGAELIIFITDCPDGSRSTIAHLLSDYIGATSPDIPEYDLTKAELVDCESGDPFVFPDPPCDETIRWETMSGEICDEGDSRYGDPVCWKEGTDACGNRVYPKGAKCPTFYPGKMDLSVALSGTCRRLQLAAAANGFVQYSFGNNGSGTNTHSIKIDQTGLGVGLAAWINAQIGGPANQVCTVTLAGDVAFTFVPSTLSLTGGTLGSGSIAFESTYPTPPEGCEDEFKAEWDKQVSANGSTAGYARGCATFTFIEEGEPMAPDCTQPLDPQPVQVGKVTGGGEPCPDSEEIQAIIDREN